MTFPYWALAVSAISGLIIRTPLRAQTDTVALAKVVQYSIPNFPAFEFTGQSPDEITRPTSAKALASALLSGLDGSGKFQQGVAIALAPRQLLRPSMDLRDYQSKSGFVFSNLSVSAGTTKVAGDSAATKLGLGARIVLLDRTDPLGPASRTPGDDAIRKALLECLPHDAAGVPTPVPANDASALKKVKACVAAADKGFRESWRAAHWNDYAVSAAVATGWGLQSSSWNQKYHLGGAAWALGAAPLCFQPALTGLCSKGQWLVKLQYENRDSVGVPSRKQFTSGLRATLGSSTFGIFGEDLYRHRSDAPAGTKASRNEWSFGFEFNIGEGIWVTSGLGSRYDELTKEGKTVVLGSFRFNLSPERQLSTIVPIPKARK